MFMLPLLPSFLSELQFVLEWQILSNARSSGTDTDGDPIGPPYVGEEDPSEINDRDEGDENESDTESSESLLVTALASTTICDSAWKSAPSYPPLYLSTLTEYLPPQAVPKLPKGLKIEDLGEEDKKDKDITWAKEKYEDSLELDQVFERFTQRVAIEGKQCIRFVI
jgi:pre-rRNA-processing protein TSR4